MEKGEPVYLLLRYPSVKPKKEYWDLPKGHMEKGEQEKDTVVREVREETGLEDIEIFDGFSIGSNDLTQLTLGIDRDGNEKIRSIANENDESVKELIRMVIKKCHSRNKYIGICGQAPSDYPDFAAFLVKEKIESISLNPDTVVKTLLRIHQEEKNKHFTTVTTLPDQSQKTFCELKLNDF